MHSLDFTVLDVHDKPIVWPLCVFVFDHCVCVCVCVLCARAELSDHNHI